MCFVTPFAFGHSIFPANQTLLGGQEWPRRVILDVGLVQDSAQLASVPQGLDEAAFGFVVATSLLWGPHWGVDLRYALIPRSSTDNGIERLQSRYGEVKFPLRLAWAKDAWMAPFVAWRERNYGVLASISQSSVWVSSARSFPLGLQLSWELLGLQVTLEGGLSLVDKIYVQNSTSEKPLTTQWSAQLDKTVENSQWANTVLGMRFERVSHRWVGASGFVVADYSQLVFSSGLRF